MERRFLRLIQKTPPSTAITANTLPPTAPPMTSACLLDDVDVDDVDDAVLPELVDIALALPVDVSPIVLVDAGRDAEGETWFGQTVKVLLLYSACCSTA